jgi:hypothetical protein
MVFKENCLATVPAKFGWIFYSRCKIKKKLFFSGYNIANTADHGQLSLAMPTATMLLVVL